MRIFCFFNENVMKSTVYEMNDFDLYRLLMRERDAQILADLHKVESQLQNVRMNTMLDSP